MHVHDAQKWRQRFILWVVLALDELGRRVYSPIWLWRFQVHGPQFSMCTYDFSKSFPHPGMAVGVEIRMETSIDGRQKRVLAWRIDRIKQIVTRSPCPSWCNDGRGNNGNKLDLHSQASEKVITPALQLGLPECSRVGVRRHGRSHGPGPHGDAYDVHRGLTQFKRLGTRVRWFGATGIENLGHVLYVSSFVNFESNTVSSAFEHGKVCGELYNYCICIYTCILWT